jgi:ADP-ribosylglycohydrolase
MWGAIAGDVVGSVYEFNNIKTKDFEPLFAIKADITDDTVCTVAVADALLHGKDPAAALRDWCNRFYVVGGWGLRFRDWFTTRDAPPYGSCGNGAAMRVSPAGWLATSLEEALEFAERVTAVTHSHPEGIKAGQVTAGAIWLCRRGDSAEAVRAWIEHMSGYDMRRTVDAIRPSYRFTELSQESVPEALICALEATSFEDALRNAISIGGDSDTIAAIAGAVAEARFGIPRWIVAEVERRLPAGMVGVMEAMYLRAQALVSTDV